MIGEQSLFSPKSLLKWLWVMVGEIGEEHGARDQESTACGSLLCWDSVLVAEATED